MATKSIIRQARKKKGWSQQELADKAGYNKKTIHRIENGRPSSIDALRNIAKALELREEDVLEDSGSGELAVRNRPRRRVRDGQECLRLLLNSVYHRTEVWIERDPETEPLHAAVTHLCSLVDEIRQHDAILGRREEIAFGERYEWGRSLGDVIRALEANGWLLELEEDQHEVFGEDWDYEGYWRLRAREAIGSEKADPVRPALPKRASIRVPKRRKIASDPTGEP